MIAQEKLKDYFKQEIPILPYWIEDDENLPYQLFCLFYLFDGDYPSDALKEDVWQEWCLLYEEILLTNLEEKGSTQ